MSAMRLGWACVLASLAGSGGVGCGAAPAPVDSPANGGGSTAVGREAPRVRWLPPGVFGVEVRVFDDGGRRIDPEVFALAMPRYRACWLDSKNADATTPSSIRTELAFVDENVVLLDGSSALGECVRSATEGVDGGNLRGNRFAIELVAAPSRTDRVVVLDETRALAAHAPMQARLDEVMACHAVGRRGDPLLAGSISVFLWFGPDGVVSGRGEIVSDVSKPLTDCVVGALSDAVMSTSPDERRYALVVVRLGTGDE